MKKMTMGEEFLARWGCTRAGLPGTHTSMTCYIAGLLDAVEDMLNKYDIPGGPIRTVDVEDALDDVRAVLEESR